MGRDIKKIILDVEWAILQVERPGNRRRFAERANYASQRTADYQAWVEAFARNHRLPIEWAEKGVRKEDHVVPWQRRMARKRVYGVYYIFKSMEQGPTFRVSVPKYP